MNIYLKPCPFCGGEALLGLRFPGDYPFRPYERRWATVSCGRCAARVTRAGLDGTEEGAAKDAAEAWNTRAERTCRVESERIIDYGYTVQRAEWTFDLSCGHSVTWDECPDYCPVCGAKVVE